MEVQDTKRRRVTGVAVMQNMSDGLRSMGDECGRILQRVA